MVAALSALKEKISAEISPTPTGCSKELEAKMMPSDAGRDNYASNMRAVRSYRRDWSGGRPADDITLSLSRLWSQPLLQTAVAYLTLQYRGGEKDTLCGEVLN